MIYLRVVLIVVMVAAIVWGCGREVEPDLATPKVRSGPILAGGTPTKHTVTDTGEFEDAWDNLADGDTIYVPANTTIEWTTAAGTFSKPNTTIYLHGAGATSILKKSGGAGIFMSVTQSSGSHTLEIKDIKFDMNFDETTFLFVNRVSTVIIDNVTTELADEGVDIITLDLTIEDTDFESTGITLDLANGTTTTHFTHLIKNCTFDRNGGSAGVVVTTDYRNAPCSVTFEGNTFTAVAAIDAALEFRSSSASSVNDTLKLIDNDFDDLPIYLTNSSGVGDEIDLLVCYDGNTEDYSECVEESISCQSCGYDDDLVLDIHEWTSGGDDYSFDSPGTVTNQSATVTCGEATVQYDVNWGSFPDSENIATFKVLYGDDACTTRGFDGIASSNTIYEKGLVRIFSPLLYRLSYLRTDTENFRWQVLIAGVGRAAYCATVAVTCQCGSRILAPSMPRRNRFDVRGG